MRIALLLSLLLAAGTGAIARGEAAPQAQPAPAPKPAAPPATTQKPAQPPPTTAKPATPAPTGQAPSPAGQAPAATPPPVLRAPAAAANARGGIAITVTDASGSTIPGGMVAADGPTQRGGETNGSGLVNFPGLQGGVLQGGVYRLRFDGDAVLSFEKEVTVRGGQVLAVDVMLNPAKKVAPPPAPVVTAPAPEAPKAGPVGELQVLSLVDLAEKELERKQPRRETLVSCSANTRSTLLQLNQDQPQRLYETADSVFYVVAGEGFLRVDGKESRLAAGSFVSVPRETPYVIGRRGRNPIILLSVLSGETCDAPK
jgi:mannose-6-phosphate isomerase-like protein (cupin superfamily)